MILCPVTKVTCSREIVLKPISDRWYSIPGHFGIDCYLLGSGVKHIGVDDGFLAQIVEELLQEQRTRNGGAK